MSFAIEGRTISKNLDYEAVIEHFRLFLIKDYQLKPKKSYKKLKDICKNYTDISNFDDELDQFLLFLQENKDTVKTSSEIYRATREMSSTFPNVEIILKIFLTIPISNVSGERSFSVLKRVKNYLRSTIGEDRLNNMAILYIEQEILNKIDTAKIIDEFTKGKNKTQALR